MTIDEAQEILLRDRGGEIPLLSLVERLRAHATLWQTGRDPQHADYCHEAADAIQELIDCVRFSAQTVPQNDLRRHLRFETAEALF